MNRPPFFFLKVSCLLLLVVATGLAPRTAHAQLSIASTVGVLPPTTPTSSLILGDRQSSLQAQWLVPLNAEQTTWKNSIESRANQTPSGAPPTNFTTNFIDASIAQAAGLRYAMTGNATDLQKAMDILLDADLSGGTFITRPEALTSYISAYDYIRGAPTSDLDAATRATIEARLLTEAQGLSNGNNTLSNARAKIGATRALAGVVLRDQALLDEGLSDLQGHFGYSTTDDGWFTDGHGHYLNYTLRHVGLFARAYQQGSGVDLFGNLQPYVDMTIGLRLPDGRTPNVSNGLNFAVALPLLSSGAPTDMKSDVAWYSANIVDHPYNWSSESNSLNNDGTYASYFALMDFEQAVPNELDRSPTFISEGQSHVAVFREDYGPTSDYLLMSAGIDSPALELISPTINIIIPAFHSHNDTGEIQLAAKGTYILVAPGYFRDDLSNSPPGFKPRQAHWHNVVLVDGDVGLAVDGRRTRPEDFMHSNRLDSVEQGDYQGASDFSTLSMQYNDTDVTRSMAYPGQDYFIVVDRMNSATTHEYGFNLVGRGTQTVLTNTADHVAVKWEFDGAQATEYLFATGSMTLTTDSQSMHTKFNNFETTQRMNATMSASQGMFLSVLETGHAGEASQLQITELAGPADMLALEVQHLSEGWVDTILAQPTQTLTTIGPLTTDALYAFGRESGGELTQAMFADGTMLMWDSQIVVEATSALTMSMTLDTPEVFLATVSADGMTPGTDLRFYEYGTILSATLDGLAIPFANGGTFSSVTLDAGGLLVVEFSTVPELRTIVLFALGQAGVVLLVRRRSRS